MPRFLNSANFLFQIFNTIGPLLLQFSKFLCSTVYLFPVISRTRTLVGWIDVLSLINTTGSIQTVKTLPGIVYCQTLPACFSFPRLGRGSARALEGLGTRLWQRLARSLNEFPCFPVSVPVSVPAFPCFPVPVPVSVPAFPCFPVAHACICNFI